jgi:hypothetical protein
VSLVPGGASRRQVPLESFAANYTDPDYLVNFAENQIDS